MSTTDYRKIIEPHGTPDFITVECSDGEHVDLTIHGDGFIQLDYATAGELYDALAAALRTVTDAHAVHPDST